MDMSQYAGSESKYLKAVDLQGKSIRVVISGVSLLEFDGEDGKKVMKPAIAFEGKEKQMVCNATSVQELIQAYGADSEDWIGKAVKLSTKHYASFGRDGIVLAPLDVQFEDDKEIPF